MEQARLKLAYKQFGEIREKLEDGLSPDLRLYSYAACDASRESEFRLPLIWNQVESDLRCLINNFNAWLGRLRAWQAWNQVLPHYCEQDQWSLRIEFLGDVAFFCMMQPSGFVDRSLEALTTVFHHANLTHKPGYRDELSTDKNVYKRIEKGHPTPYDFFESRGEIRRRIQDLSEGWGSALVLLEQLDSLNDADYQTKTMDFRNRASHSFAPHFDLGIVPTVTRRPGFASKMVKRPDGRYDALEDRSHRSVSYGYGELPPLSSSEALAENAKQLQVARKLLVAYEALLNEVDERLSLRQGRSGSNDSPTAQEQTKSLE
ncbi:hypothetical protein J2W49_004234 [Hydrogenophaga palleronii]|uniref:Cthe-2314-like HEPN domain-containing protein n=1 Tax=Hydrogenophaga palleronii TaxID=65655 RepID=A0ABU1WSH4_9BURK|nr:hypothetical protein [Hydrogenophaga palleronii]MDR7152258.1 hypothetical protein [Hydrogenophaga palleronii]